MKEQRKIWIVLPSLIIASVALLTLANHLTIGRIQENIAEKAEMMSRGLFPEADSVMDKAKYSEYYKGDTLLGYLAEGAAYGYSSEVKVLAAFGPDMKIIGVRVLEQQETPGLGTKVAESSFLSQFSGLAAEDAALSKDNGRIDAVTGATKSSNAVVNAVKDAYNKVQR